MRCSVNRLLQLATKPRLQSMRSDTSSQVWPSASSKISRARRASSARSVRLWARRVSSISSEFDNVMASLMDAIIVYKWLLQSTRSNSATDRGIPIRGSAIRRTPRLHHQLPLEGLRRQLSRGLPHPHCPPRPDEGNRLRPISHGHFPLLLPAIRAHPRDESRRRRRTPLRSGRPAAASPLLLGLPESDAQHLSRQHLNERNCASLPRQNTDHLRMVFPRYRHGGESRAYQALGGLQR